MTIETLAQPAELYERDFYLWTQTQAEALRAAAASGANLPVDWNNVAEEIESLGRSDAREVRSRIAVILLHLLKLAYSTASEPRRGWRHEIKAARRSLERVLADSPSLRRRVPDMIAQEWPQAIEDAREALAEFGEAMPVEVGPPWSVDEVLGEWLPAP